MHRKLLFINILLFFAASISSAFGWGDLSHKMINKAACGAVPSEIRNFFLANADYLSEHAIDPDLWKKNDKSEGPKHYIDIDMYGSYPFNVLPHSFEEAKKKYGEDVVIKRGTLPWIIVEYTNKLTDAMKRQNKDEILLFAAALGHYVSDAHMPLHTVENYDGQLTGNKGIHARFEVHMINKYPDKFKILPAEGKYLSDPLEHAFSIVLESYVWADNLLVADTKAKQGEPDYNDSYFAKLLKYTKHIADQQMSSSAENIASYWYAAWKNAGEPKLP